MITREFTADELDELDEQTIEVSSHAWRHGRRVTYVVEHEGAHWQFSVNVHHDGGWEDMDEDTRLVAKQVRPVEKTVTAWEVVP